ncbi:MAG: bifunctional glutamate N-acetyltransferase/amino-acid acetyltransferase ArgJ [Pseudomonadota bacterium]|nr:bifunctional glutamate N-acetyltransferase/amino-acid acetyltransferase ArgJ [Pseudomonadota bacterium]
MAVGPDSFGPVASVAGVLAATASAGVRRANRPDVVLFRFDEGTTCAATFTRNAFCAAPVLVAKEHLTRCSPRAFLINSGNANAGTGPAGLKAARVCCEAVAGALGCQPEAVLPFSTGVIGEQLPAERIAAVVPRLVVDLSADGWGDAAKGIMTTDTRPKGATRHVRVGEHTVTLSGIAKGAGMIRPDMATMLAFLATDAAVSSDDLQKALEDAVEVSFNRISVDGDTSTNDACAIAATGKAAALRSGGPGWSEFNRALKEVCVELAQAIVRDGEGATKFITVAVHGARDQSEARQVADTITQSPLVKTAFFASDPNWGRILAAVGRAGIPELDISGVSLQLDDVPVVTDGMPDSAYCESRGQSVMNRDEITVRIDLGRGDAVTTVWTCDLSYDYVRINADYRT